MENFEGRAFAGGIVAGVEVEDGAIASRWARMRGLGRTRRSRSRVAPTSSRCTESPDLSRAGCRRGIKTERRKMGLEDFDERPGGLRVAMCDQPGNDEKRAFLGTRDLIKAGLKARRQIGEAPVAQEKGVKGAPGCGPGWNAQTLQLRLFMSFQCTACRSAPGGESAHGDFQRDPRGKIRHRLARPDAQPASQHVPKNASPLHYLFPRPFPGRLIRVSRDGRESPCDLKKRVS